MMKPGRNSLLSGLQRAEELKRFTSLSKIKFFVMYCVVICNQYIVVFLFLMLFEPCNSVIFQFRIIKLYFNQSNLIYSTYFFVMTVCGETSRANLVRSFENASGLLSFCLPFAKHSLRTLFKIDR